MRGYSRALKAPVALTATIALGLTSVAPAFAEPAAAEQTVTTTAAEKVSYTYNAALYEKSRVLSDCVLDAIVAATGAVGVGDGVTGAFRQPSSGR